MIPKLDGFVYIGTCVKIEATEHFTGAKDKKASDEAAVSFGENKYIKQCVGDDFNLLIRFINFSLYKLF